MGCDFLRSYAKTQWFLHSSIILKHKNGAAFAFLPLQTKEHDKLRSFRCDLNTMQIYFFSDLERVEQCQNGHEISHVFIVFNVCWRAGSGKCACSCIFFVLHVSSSFLFHDPACETCRQIALTVGVIGLKHAAPQHPLELLGTLFRQNLRGHTRIFFKDGGGRGVYYYVESHIPTCRKSNIALNSVA